jgi:hypothetical protein
VAASFAALGATIDRPAGAQPALAESLGPAVALVAPVVTTARRELTSWIAAISRNGLMPRDERLLVVAPDGVVMDTIDGTAARVALPRSLEVQLFDRSNRISLVHNHPGSSGLSGADLSQLRKPGVLRIVALGHDGSVFEAKAGPRYSALMSNEQTYSGLVQRILFRVEIEQRWTDEDMTDVLRYVGHLAALALHRADVISYRATLSPHAVAILERFSPFVDRVLTTEVKQLQKELAKSRSVSAGPGF